MGTGMETGMGMVIEISFRDRLPSSLLRLRPLDSTLPSIDITFPNQYIP